MIDSIHILNGTDKIRLVFRREFEFDKPATKEFALIDDFNFIDPQEIDRKYKKFLYNLSQALKDDEGNIIFMNLVRNPLFIDEVDPGQVSEISRKLSDVQILFIFYHFLIRMFEEKQEIFEDVSNFQKTYFRNYMLLKLNRVKFLKKNCSTSINGDKMEDTFLYNASEKIQLLKLEIIKDWIGVCTNKEDNDANMYFLVNDDRVISTFGVENTRESFINYLIFEDGGYCKELSPFFSDNILNDLLEHLIHEWYFRKYDLHTIRVIYRLNKKQMNKQKNNVNKKKTLRSYIPIICIFLIIAISIAILLIDRSQNIKVYKGNTYYNFEDIFSIFKEEPLLILIQVAILVFIGYILIRYGYDFIKYRLKSYNLLLLRLTGSIVIGYIPLILAGDTFGFFLTCNYKTAIVLCVVSLSVSYIYILLEIYNGLENKISRRVILSRTNCIFVKGLVRSSILGVYIIDIFSRIGKTSNLLQEYNIVGGYNYNTIFGVFNIKTYILLIPMALMLGMIVQIVWEDKEITYPI